jgi:YihY family inner membrane protein
MAEETGALERARQMGEDVQRTWPVRIVMNFLNDRGPNQAVLVAWNLLQTLIPIVLILLAVSGFLLHLVGLNESSIRTLVLQFAPAGNGTREALVAAIAGVQQHTGIFAILALLTFLWAASSLFGCLEQVMADSYRIKTRNIVVQKLMAVVLMLLFCILVVVAIGASAVTAFVRQLQLPYVPEWITQGATGPVLSALVGVLSGLVLFFTLFWLLPKQHPPPQHVLPGAVFSGVLFYVLTLVFPLYLTLNQGINRYGSDFAFLFTLLFFFYFVGLITVLGIHINSTLFPLPQEQRDPAPPTTVPVSRRIPRPLFGVLGGALALVLAVVAGAAATARLPTRR